MNSQAFFKNNSTHSLHKSDSSCNFTNRYLSDQELRKPSEELGREISRATKHQLASSVQSNIQKPEAQYVKLTQGSERSTKIVKIQRTQEDPLELKGFRQRKAPKQAGSPPKTIMHSPVRKVTAKDQEDWQIPPCVSNSVNGKSYTIPLEMRVAADGRTLQKKTVNSRFAKQADALFVAEREARKAVQERNKIQKAQEHIIYVREENKIKEAADLARKERNKIIEEKLQGNQTENLGKRRDPYDLEEEEEARKERDNIRYTKRREIERERRLEVSRKRSKGYRDRERDISEKIALGQAQPTAFKESMYDQRLFNQSSGLNSGFEEDFHEIYSKPLFQDRSRVHPMYTEGNEEIDKDTEMKGRINKPIEFERYI